MLAMGSDAGEEDLAGVAVVEVVEVAGVVLGGSCGGHKSGCWVGRRCG
jgi:hypothetical protein